MIKKLTEKNRQQILDFCYKKERENLFAIGSFKNEKNPFSANKYYGYFKGKNLIGLAVFFSRFGHLLINAPRRKTIEEFVDYGMHKKLDIKCVATFRKYAEATIERLEKAHNKKPTRKSDETVFILTRQAFRNFSDGAEQNATKKDIDDIVVFNRKMRFENAKGEITTKERKKVMPEHTFFIRMKNNIISKANIHGLSKNYFQIGGVGTLEEFRKMGLAKKVVSRLCEHYFDMGIKYGLLFTGNDNVIAQKVYKNIGFKPVDEFIVAEYK
jgi:uncharacterized protein